MQMNVRSITAVMVVVVLLTAGIVPAIAQERRGGGRGPQVPPLIMTTTAFEDGTVIPAKYVGPMGVSPELKWTQVPPERRASFCSCTIRAGSRQGLDGRDALVCLEHSGNVDWSPGRCRSRSRTA